MSNAIKCDVCTESFNKALWLWDTCVPVQDDAEVLRYLTAPRAEGGRGIVNAANVPKHIARVLPLKTEHSLLEHKAIRRLVFPLYDANGVHRSVLARAVMSTPPNSLSESLHSGLVLANDRARGMLCGNPLQPANDGEFRIIIAEREIDWLTWVAQGGETVIGIGSGSWTPELVARLPDGAVLVVRVHGNDAGVRYAQDILDSVRDRVKRLKLTVRLSPHFKVDGWRVMLNEDAAEWP